MYCLIRTDPWQAHECVGGADEEGRETIRGQSKVTWKSTGNQVAELMRPDRMLQEQSIRIPFQSVSQSQRECNNQRACMGEADDIARRTCRRFSKSSRFSVMSRKELLPSEKTGKRPSTPPKCRKPSKRYVDLARQSSPKLRYANTGVDTA